MSPYETLRQAPVLTTPRLVVRMAGVEDAAEIVRYYTENEAHLAHSRPTPSAGFYTTEFWESQAHAALAELRSDRSLRLFLYGRDEPQRVVGNVNFTGFNRGAAHFCYLGYGVAGDLEGRGLMREALESAIPYVFDQLNMHRVMANYVPWNRRSGGLLRRLGFQVEGYARDYLFLNGRWEDHVLTSLTNPNWRQE